MDLGGTVLTLRSGLAWSLTAHAALFAALATFAGMTATGWLTGVGCAVTANATAVRSLRRGATDAFGPADLVTFVRVALACGVAALVADSVGHVPVDTALVVLATVALVLDAVDGWVARRTRTSSAFGARFDGEVDAFLILVLSVYVAGSLGGWIVAIGAARYVFAVAGWALPWLRVGLPTRYWRKVVAAVQGIVLTVAAAAIAPPAITYAMLATALALLAESFGRDVWWLWCHNRIALTAVKPARPASP